VAYYCINLFLYAPPFTLGGLATLYASGGYGAALQLRGAQKMSPAWAFIAVGLAGVTAVVCLGLYQLLTAISED
jgi:hypothetical protein